MQDLITYQNNLLKGITNHHFRYLFNTIKSKPSRMVGIKGLRGTGKTTLMLQYLKYVLKDISKGLYVSAEHPYFYNHTLFEAAEEFNNLGGKYLLIDEVHKYQNWSRELKIIYDGFPDLRIIFSASSILELFKGESDLSRRVISYELTGLSFREYLDLIFDFKIERTDLLTILKNHTDISNEISKIVKKPLFYFKKYLKTGYFPYILEGNEEEYLTKIVQGIDVTLNSDLPIIENYSATHISKIKKLLGVISETVPFEPNLSEIAREFSISRDTVSDFLQHLSKARLLNLLHRNVKGAAVLRKPDKIYLENTNFSHALKHSPETGTIRETFFLNQIKNSGINILLPEAGDFIINNKYTIEVGGKNKTFAQIKNIPDSYIVSDDIETGYVNKIPLYLFGFLN